MFLIAIVYTVYIIGVSSIAGFAVLLLGFFFKFLVLCRHFDCGVLAAGGSPLTYAWLSVPSTALPLLT